MWNFATSSAPSARRPRMPRRPLLRKTPLCAALLVATGCASAVAPSPPARYGTDHPLVGRAWAPAETAFLSEDELTRRLADVRIVLLGERHDNPDHHRLQAWALRRMGELGRRPVMVFEMINRDRQQAVDGCRSARRCRSADLAAAAEWNEQGWPDWRIYDPVLSYVTDNDYLVIAGGLERTLLREVARGGSEVLEPELRARLAIDETLPRATREAMIEEIRISHCGHPPEHLLAGMVQAQRLRDAYMASQLAAVYDSGTAVLIAGNGHVRTDWAVPAHLRRAAPKAGTLSVGLIEVRDGLDEPGAYAELFRTHSLPFDVVWFTARVDDEDPCAKYKEQLERMRDEHPAPAHDAPPAADSEDGGGTAACGDRRLLGHGAGTRASGAGVTAVRLRTTVKEDRPGRAVSLCPYIGDQTPPRSRKPTARRSQESQIMERSAASAHTPGQSYQSAAPRSSRVTTSDIVRATRIAKNPTPPRMARRVSAVL